MDAETAEAVDTLRDDIHQVKASLNAEIRQVEAALRADIHRVRTEMHELNGNTKRHMDVVAESLRDDIRIIAEGVVALSAKVDSLRR